MKARATAINEGALRPLLRRTQLLPGESLPSLLVRLSQLNGYDRPGILSELVGARTTGGGKRSHAGRLKDDMERPQTATTYLRLSALTLTTPVELYRATTHSFAPTILPPGEECAVLSLPAASTWEPKTGYEIEAFPYLQSVPQARTLKGPPVPAARLRLVSSGLVLAHCYGPHHAQFCPLCLRHAAYHRLVWMLQAVSACLEHKCLLCSQCPHCGTTTTIADVTYAVCGRCGAALEEAEAFPLAHDLFGLHTQLLLQGWLVGASEYVTATGASDSVTSASGLGHGTAPASEPLPQVEETLGASGMSGVPSIPGVSGVSCATRSYLEGLPEAPCPVLYRVIHGLRHSISAVQTGADWSYLHTVPGLHSGAFPSTSVTEKGATKERPLARQTGLRRTLTPAVTYVLYATAVKALCDWPHGFNAFLSRYHTLVGRPGPQTAKAERALQRDGNDTAEDGHSGAQVGSTTGSHSAQGTARASGKLKCIADEFGSLYDTWVRRDWQDPAFAFFREAFYAYLRSNNIPAAGPSPLRGGTWGYKWGLGKLASDTGYIRFSEAALLLGTDEETVRALVRSRRLRGQRLRQGPVSRAVFVTLLEVEELRQRRRDRITLERAAAIFNVPPLTVLEMVRRGLLKAEYGPYLDGSPAWLFSEAGIAECWTSISMQAAGVKKAEQQLHASDGTYKRETGYTSRGREVRLPAKVTGPGRDTLLTLHQATRMLAVLGLSTVDALTLLLEGELHAVVTSPSKGQASTTRTDMEALTAAEAQWPPNMGLDNLYFLESSVLTYLRRIMARRDWIGYLEVAAHMNVVKKHRVVIEWARRGLLPAVRSRYGEYLFAPEDAARFVATHMVVGEASAYLGVGINTIRAWVRVARLAPVSGPGVDEGLVFLFRREDIEDFN